VTTAILLSGGVDSNAVAWWQRPEIAFTLDYGQLAAASEIGAAREIASLTGMHHEVVRVDCSSIGSGDMAGSSPDALAPVTEWWPYRNQLLVTLAAARGVALGVRRILVGAVVTDASHTDGTPAFFNALDALMRLQEGEITIEAPAITMSTVELVRVSGIPRDVLAWSHSCHTGPFACGGCRGCVKHFETMNELYGDAY
jgi:7-cyano-7-deazaguanine synthase